MGERPKVTKTTHPLPFNQLSPDDFERLTLWLIEREGYERIEALGEAGGEQGRDLIAWKDGSRVSFQCKRVRQFGPKSAEAEIEKIRGLSEEEKPDELIFVLTRAVSVRTRNAARTAWDDEQTCHFWTGNELDHKVKQHQEIVEEFFEFSKAGSGFIVRERGIGIAGDVADSQVISGEQVTVNIYSGGTTSKRQEERSERNKHRARYADDESEELSGRLKDLYSRRKKLVIAGEDPRLVEGEILDVRRLLRKGPLLRTGEFLSDGRYELLEPLGKGGFATVWKAWESDADRLVALKVLHGHYSEDRSARERFFRGARKMAELAHPQIVRVYDREREDDGWYFFAMEHLPGGDYEQAVLAGRLTFEERLSIVLETGVALAWAHRKGVIHRDVKPSNILLDGEGRAKLSDFDLVRADDTTGLTKTQAMMGSVQFAAPEALISAKSVQAAADIYSLGSTAVFGVLGQPLPPLYYRDPARQITKLRCIEPIKVALARATAFDPCARYRSVVEFCRDLEEASDDVELVELGKQIEESVAAEASGRKLLDGELLLEEDAESAQLRGNARDQYWAETIWRRLEGQDPERQEAILGETTVTSAALFNLIIEKSREIGRRDPKQGVQNAELALVSLKVLVRRGGDEKQFSSLKARGWTRLANARSLVPDLRGAELGFDEAERLLEGGGRQPAVEAELLAYRASLRRDQRRFLKARKLLERAREVCPYTESDLLAKILLIQASVHFEEGNPTAAIPFLELALPLAGKIDDAILKLATYHNLVATYSEAGWYHKAVKLLPIAKQLSEDHGTDYNRIRFNWLEGLVARGVGELDEAEEALMGARDSFSEMGDGFNTALVSLDLADLYSRQNRTTDLIQLCKSMAPLSGMLQKHHEAMVALQIFQRAAEEQSVTSIVVEKARKVLLRSQKQAIG